jgi:hypothetical protein
MQLPLIDLAHRLIIFWSPRCGSTATLIWFFNAIGEQERLRGTSAHRLRTIWLEEQQDLYRRLDDFYTDDSFTRIVVARNPYDRAVSSYYLAITSPVTSQWKEVRRTLPDVDDERRLSFREFVRFLTLIDLSSCDLHWRLQSAQDWHEKRLKIDEFVRVESLEADLRRIGDRLGIQAPIKLASVSPPAEQPELSKLCDLDLIELEERFGRDEKDRLRLPSHHLFFDDQLAAEVRRLYEQDFSALGYDPGRW